MPANETLKTRVCAAIDARRSEILEIGEDIRLHPELGFKEFRTAQIAARYLSGLGIGCRTGIGVTGVRGTLRGRGGTTVAYLGELDSVLVRDHPDADPTTGAAHACGHNCQIANLLALAAGLVDSGVVEELDGCVALMAVPAEEYVEVTYRRDLRRSRTIEFLGGKPELIRLGAFDDVQITMMTHQSSRPETGRHSVGGPSNGCVVKLIDYQGRAAHAGGAPHLGINALKAAMLGLQAIDANREAFRDEDHIRVHPIITKGGDLVNVIPADVRLETYVRGASVEAIAAAAARVDRALKAGAMALGATVTIDTLPGYMPRLVAHELAALYRANVVALSGEGAWTDPTFGAGSTDMGDISHIMPSIEAQARGTSGTGHGADYQVCDPEVAYIEPAKLAAMTIIDLLADGAGEAKRIIGAYDAPMTKEQYLATMRSIARTVTWSATDE